MENGRPNTDKVTSMQNGGTEEHIRDTSHVLKTENSKTFHGIQYYDLIYCTETPSISTCGQCNEKDKCNFKIED